MISLGTPRVVFSRTYSTQFFLNHIVILVSSPSTIYVVRHTGEFLLVFVFCWHFQVIIKIEPIRCVVVCKTGTVNQTAKGVS